MTLTIGYMPLVLLLLVEGGLGESTEDRSIADPPDSCSLWSAGLRGEGSLSGVDRGTEWPPLLKQSVHPEPGSINRSTVGDVNIGNIVDLFRDSRHLGEHSLSPRRLWNRVASRRSGP